MEITSAGVLIQHPDNPELFLCTGRGLCRHLCWLPGLQGFNWVLVGGVADPGETPVQTAIRETFEETGVQLTEADLDPEPFVARFGDEETLTAFYRVRKPVRRFKRLSWEGWVSWQPLSKILDRDDAFARYNLACFKHFGLLG